MRDACSFLFILVGPRICGVNHFAVRKSRNSVITLFLSNLSKFRLKSPVSIIFLLSFFIFFNVLLRSCKNSLSFCFGCLKITPIRMLSFIGLFISYQSASNSVCVFLQFKLRSGLVMYGIVSFI